MGTRRNAAWAAAVALALLAGCATSPEAESRSLAMEADIRDILNQPVTEAQVADIEAVLDGY